MPALHEYPFRFPQPMDPQLTKLIKMLKIWLNKNSLDGDLHYYTIEDGKSEVNRI